jgi:hypothetical protein
LRLVRLEDRRVLNAAPLALLAGSELTVQTGDADGQSDLVHLFATRDGGAERLHVELNGAEIFAGDAAQISKVNVRGSVDDDVLLVDFGNGNPLPHGGLWFDAGGQTAGDELRIGGGSVASVNHSLAADASGAVTIESLDGFATVTFAHVENLHDALQADTREITIAAEADQATLSNGDSDDLHRVTTDLGTSDTFASPFERLTIQLGSSSSAIEPGGTLSVDGDVSIPGGTVLLDAGSHGTLLVSGRIDASDHVSGGFGGTVHLLGERVGVFDGAIVDVSGDHGGGTILLGGDLQGDNAAIHNAEFSYVASEARLLADATSFGDGGRIIVWADDSTRVFGELSAHGGAAGGRGGFVETSGRIFLDVRSTPLLSSVDGAGGTWLLDPNNATVGVGGTVNFTVVNPFTTTDDNAFLDLGRLRNAMTGGANVIVQTAAAGANTQAGDLRLVSAFDFAGTGTNTLAFIAHNSVIIDGPIFTSSVDTLNLVLQANSDGVGGGDVIIHQPINLGNGSFNSTGVNFTAVQSVQSQGGMIAIDHTGNVEIRAPLNTSGDMRVATSGGAITRPPSTGLLVANDLLLSAANGIGTPTDRMLVQVANNLAARVTSANATDGIFITERFAGGNLHIGEVNDAAGVPVVGVTTSNNKPVDVRTENGSLFIDRDVKADGTGNVFLLAGDTLGGGASDLEILANITGDEVVLVANDEINQNSSSSVTTGRTVLLDGFNGVGDDPAKVEVQVAVAMAAQLRNPNATGGVFVRESNAGGDLPIGTVQGVVGLSTTNNRPIEARTSNGNILVNADINANGAGNVTLRAESTGAPNSIVAGGGRVITGSGTIDLNGLGIGVGAASPLPVRVGTGELSLTTTGVGAAGDIAITNDSAVGLATGQIAPINTDASEQTVTIRQTAGNLIANSQFGDAADNLRLHADTAAIAAATGSTVFARNILLESANGIGDGTNAVEVVPAGVLAARLTSPTASGDIVVRGAHQGQDLNIGTFVGVPGIATTNNRSITVSTVNGGIVIGADVAANGAGNVSLTTKSAGAASDLLAGTGRISTSTGTISLSARGIGTGAAGAVLTGVSAGQLTLTSTGSAAEGDIAISNNSPAGLNTNQVTAIATAADSQRITIGQTVGIVALGNPIGNAADDLVLQAGMGTITGAGVVTARDLLLDAGLGIGDAGVPVTTQVNGQLAARVTSVAGGGGITILEAAAGADLTIGTFAGVTGVSTVNGQTVNLKADGGRLAINSAVSVTGNANVSLRSAGTQASVDVNAAVGSMTGLVQVQSEIDIRFGGAGAGRIQSVTGDVQLAADFNADGTGAVTMGDLNLIDAGSGHVLVQAAGDVTLGGLRTTNADCTPVSSAVRIVTTSGGVVDGGETLIDVDAPNGQLQILTTTGIGSSGPFGALETRVACLDVETQTSGNVAIDESDGVLVFRANNRGPGTILIRGNGTMTVDNSAGGFGAAVNGTSGAVTLAASGGASDLIVNSGVVTTSGAIALTADDDVRFGAAGDVNSNNGDVAVTADADRGAGVSGSVTMNADTRINAGTGVITFTSDGDVVVTGLSTLSSAFPAVSITSRESGIVDAGDSAVDVAAPLGAVELFATTGIGSGNRVEINAGRLQAGNATSGDIDLGQLAPIVIERIHQVGPGNVTVISGGTLTVNFFSTTTPAIEATSGNIFLDANAPGADLILHGGLLTTTGNITGEADRDIQFGFSGTVLSNSGTVVFTAGRDAASTTGRLTMDPNSQVNPGTGMIVLVADQDLRVTGLRTNFTSPPDAVTIRSENGTVFDAGDASTDVVAPNGCLNVIAPGGIDTTNPLEINVACASGAAAGASGGTRNQNPNDPQIFFLPGPGGTPGGGLTPGGGPPPPSTNGKPPPENGPGPGPGNPRPGGGSVDAMREPDRGGRQNPELPTDFLVNVSRVFAPDERDTVMPEPVRLDAVPITEQEVILRPLDGTGREVRSIRLPDDVLDDLPGLFKKLERGRFRIYFREAGEERVLLIREVKLLDGRPVDDSDAGLDKPPTPAAGSRPRE